MQSEQLGGDNHQLQVPNMVIVDVEATCTKYKNAWPRSEMEIIEIGGVLIDDEYRTVGQFTDFVQPIIHTQLTDFCTELTSIKQCDVDNADKFPAVFSRFLNWVAVPPTVFGTWGNYDLDQFRRDCTLHKVALPQWFEIRHVNIKQAFCDWQEVPPKKRSLYGVMRALNELGITFKGTHHRGIDDAINIAQIATTIPKTFLTSTASR